ncbi:hypothetical protein J4Q44_G00168090 [Coregonus suidteri]|uniref:Selenoprotein P N-terminal domain-containing protein n=1 Tax=Coregonus suidteri TaxID=861788 RepID=A0AAN8R518_9TELE
MNEPEKLLLNRAELTEEGLFTRQSSLPCSTAMWAGLSLLLALCLLPGGGTESEGEGTRCKPPPGWSIGEASLLDGLRLKLEGQGLENVTYMVVNHQGQQAQRLHTMLRKKLSENITLYQQEPKQDDVWQTLAGEKDDFLIYDRCGRLTYHISLPYSILDTPYVENAIKETYCTRICGDCTYESNEIPAECNRTVEAKPEGEEKPVTGGETTHGGHGHHHHGHGHAHNGNRHSHGHHGERGMGRDHRRDHGAEQQQQQQQQHQHGAEGLQHGQAHGQLHVGQEHMGQQAVQLGQMPQERQGGHIMQNP